MKTHIEIQIAVFKLAFSNLTYLRTQICEKLDSKNTIIWSFQYGTTYLIYINSASGIQIQNVVCAIQMA